MKHKNIIIKRIIALAVSLVSSAVFGLVFDNIGYIIPLISGIIIFIVFNIILHFIEEREPTEEDEIYPPRRKRRHTFNEYSDKDTNSAMLLWLFFWWVGGHRFYVGKYKTGMIYIALALIIILGLIINPNSMVYPIFMSFLILHILSIIDSFRISHGKFYDSENHPLESSHGWKVFIYIFTIPAIALLVLIITMIIYFHYIDILTSGDMTRIAELYS